MARYKLSSQANKDISEIADYSLEQWGLRQSRLYRDKLNTCFNMLAENPTIGRDASEFQPKLRRYLFEAHTIFYLISNQSILVVRILGNRMDHKKHL